MFELIQKSDLVRFVFILAVPIVLSAGAVVTLFAVGALFDALDHPQEVGQRISAAFRGQPPAGKLAGPGHYYQPYWK
jgi:hypothetical protein